MFPHFMGVVASLSRLLWDDLGGRFVSFDASNRSRKDAAWSGTLHLTPELNEPSRPRSLPASTHRPIQFALVDPSKTGGNVAIARAFAKRVDRAQRQSQARESPVG